MKRILLMILTAAMMLCGSADNAQAATDIFLRKVMHGIAFPPNEAVDIHLEADHYGRTLGINNPCSYRFYVVDQLTKQAVVSDYGKNEETVTLPSNGGRLNMYLDILLQEGRYSIYYEWLGAGSSSGPFYFWDFVVGNPPPLPVPIAVSSFYLTDSWLSIIDDDEPSYLQSKGSVYNTGNTISVSPRQWHSGLDNAKVTVTLTEAGSLFLNGEPVSENNIEFTFSADFTNPVTLTVVAADNAETRNYTVTVNNPSGNTAGLNGVSLIWNNEAVGVTTNNWGSSVFTVTLPAGMPSAIGGNEFSIAVSSNINSSVVIEGRPVDCMLSYSGNVNGNYGYNGRLDGFTLNGAPYTVIVTSPDGTVTKEYTIMIAEGATDPGAASVWINDEFQSSIRGVAYKDDPYRSLIEDPILITRLGNVAIQLFPGGPNLPEGEGEIFLRLSEEQPTGTIYRVAQYPQEWHTNPEIYFDNHIFDIINPGRYDVILRVDQEYTLGGITLTDEQPVFYGVNVGTLAGGSVDVSKGTSTVGKTIEVWVTPNPEHELQSFNVVDEDGVPLFLTTGSGGNFTKYYSFIMPSCNVTIMATFIEMTDDSAIETAKAVLASNSAGICMGDTHDTMGMKELIATYINRSITRQTGITVTAADIEIGEIVPSNDNKEGSYTYTVRLTKGNANENVTDTNFISRTYAYSIVTGSYTGGYVSSNPLRSDEGTLVTLEINPYTYNGYELEAIAAHKTGDKNTPVELEGTGNTRTFTMPAHTVTVIASFRLTENEQTKEDEEAIGAAKDDIEAVEGGTYRIMQVTGNTAEAIKSWLRQTLGLLFAEKHNIQLRSSAETEIVGELNITDFTAAMAGTEANPNGTNGSFTFTVTLSRGKTTMDTEETSGIIQATPYSAPSKRISLQMLDELTARISNTGDISTGKLTLELSGDNADAFTLSATSVNDLNVEATTDITITPRIDLPTGNYKATLTVSGSGLTAVSAEFTHSVIAIGIDKPQSESLLAYVCSGTLHIDGLTTGGYWNVYTLSGILIYQGIAQGYQAKVNLPVRGMYIIKSGKESAKVLY